MSGDPLPPVTLGEVRRLGFPLSMSCALCNHSAALPLDVARDLPDDATMHDVACRLRARATLGRAAGACSRTPGCGLPISGRRASGIGCRIGPRSHARPRTPACSPLSPRPAPCRTFECGKEKGARQKFPD
jgi:hypothetical protein